MGPSDLVDLLRLQAQAAPDRGYAFFMDGVPEPARLRYPALDRRARAIAARLQAEGAIGEAVLILCPPGLDYIAAFFGCLYAGAIATPAYPPDPTRLRRTLPRLSAIVADTGARLALGTELIASLAPMIAAECAALADLTWLAVDAIDDAGAEAWRAPSLGPDALAFLQYTSGSTADPKGVMLTHGNLLDNLGAIVRAFSLRPDARLAFWLPPYHDMGLIGGILVPLSLGCDVALMSPLDFLRRPMMWLEMVARTRADMTGAPNFAYDLCVRRSTPEARAALDLSCLTLAFNAAEPIRAETMDAFAQAFAVSGFSRDSAYTCFGLAEGTLLATGTQRGTCPRQLTVSAAALEAGRVELAEHGRRLVSCGRAPEGSALRIVDPVQGRVCGERVVGEIWLRSPSVARGYWKNEAATRRTFHGRTEEGDGLYLRTGDLGFLDEGELFFVTRQKDLVILRGRNHYPQDLERAAEGAHAALRPGCGVAFALERGGEERLVVAWEIDPAKAPDHATVIARIRAEVAAREDAFVDTVLLLEPRALPKTSSGKLQRQHTRAEYLDGSLAVLAEGRAPELAATASTEGSLEDFLVERVAAGLGLDADAVDLDVPLRDLGLDSRMVVELTEALSTRVGRRLPVTIAFDYPTIKTLTRHLAAV